MIPNPSLTKRTMSLTGRNAQSCQDYPHFLLHKLYLSTMAQASKVHRNDARDVCEASGIERRLCVKRVAGDKLGRRQATSAGFGCIIEVMMAVAVTCAPHAKRAWMVPAEPNGFFAHRQVFFLQPPSSPPSPAYTPSPSPTSAMRFFLAALAALPAARAAISIIQPSASEYWVQYETNTITWNYNAGDPSLIDIIVSNIDNTTLNGNFSIAQYVNVSAETFTVTNVTLVVGSNYQVSFLDPANASIIYATSGTFSVDAPGSDASSSSASGSASASGASGTSPSSSGSGASSSNTSSSAPKQLGMSAGGIMGVIAACGVASLSALLL
ncbi:hypothetical protein DAEQUDRAFT_718421 [Daedalea quercina L-15889]|uniref:Yeast cell wall synthesis Kre9/Knh1-like N-terminal domain-containing protein n=1 Tax=Daedalea quercina L-15889 TaxID=1314783 RepID=A0A165LBQ5_9APHY|nr:hypothetical protein DAEQUDRAFT_718421 [Daedalea quercina L-15889]